MRREMVLILFFFIFMLQFELRNSVTLRGVYKKTSRAIGKKGLQLENVLKEYYFTDERDNSIWWLANTASAETFNITLDLKHLLSMETTLKKLANHFYTCSNLGKNKRRSQCFNRYTDLLKGGIRDFIWDASPDVSGEGKAKIGTQYTAYAVFSGAIATLTADNLYLLNDWSKKNDVIDHLISILSGYIRMLFVYEKDVTKWRCDQISPVTVCETTKIFWKEYTQACETRWKRDMEDDDANGSEMFDDNQNDDPKLDVADRLGGKLDFRSKAYQAKVFDGISGKVLFKKEIIVPADDIRGSMLNKFKHEGMRKRWIEEKKMRSVMKKFHRKTIKPARKVLAKILNYLNALRIKY